MGRQKITPKKLNNSNNDWDLQNIIVDYIPKTKRTRKKNRKSMSHNVLICNEDNKQYHLGELCIGTTENVFPDSFSQVRVVFLAPQEDNTYMLMKCDDASIVVKLAFDTNFIKDIFTSKLFAVNLYSKDQSVYTDIYLKTLPLQKFNQKLGLSIKTLFALLYNISCNDITDEEITVSSTIEQLYKNIQMKREIVVNLGDINVQHPQLKPILRPYQTNAVRWMLHRENMSDKCLDETIHPLYTAITLTNGLEIYYDKYTGYLDINKPVFQQSHIGGILADEMGLGKTVEVFACILLHPKPTTNETNPNKDINNLNKIPLIDKQQNRKRKRKIPDNLPIVEPKQLKIPDDVAKSNGKKTQTRIVLEMWYNNCLKGRTSTEVIKIECICGDASSDEKTVQCIDCNKLQHPDCLGYNIKYGKYRCPQCWMNQAELLECGATLIVTPKSLRTQWCNEIRKHIKGNFKVLQYDGVSVAPIYPTNFLKYDVVITSYSVLQSELRLIENGSGISLRKLKKYAIPGCPLISINWWRLCLDEAQTVDSPTLMVSAMAQKIHAKFRWAVTGTPISKGISDLYGLIDYLQIQPYNDQITWKNLLLNPFLCGDVEPMQTFLSQVMWRSSKNEVIDQINIPKQTIEIHSLEFSAIEKYFYKCEHQLAYESFLIKKNIFDSDTRIQKLDRVKLKYLLEPLLSLRQVCTYPNTTRMRYLATKKPVRSMKELLDALILKNTNESEECLRLIISALNGLAGIYLLLQNPYEALDNYRNVLQLNTRFTKEETLTKLSVDKLQLIHAMHNILEILILLPDADPTLRDATLREECSNLEQEYIKKFINQTYSALQDNLSMSDSVIKLQNSFILQPGQWYSDIIKWISLQNFNQELLTRIANAHDTANVQCQITLNDHNLVYILGIWDEEISDLRVELIESINELYEYYPENEFKIIINQNLVQNAKDCHLTTIIEKKSKTKKKCLVCLANVHLKNYEVKLFSMSKRTKTFDEMALQGSWKPTSEELIFKSLLALGKAKNADSNIIQDAEIYVNLIEALKKEFKEIRRLWTFLDQQICAQDELNMCKIRLRLKENENKISEPKTRVESILKNLAYNSENKFETIHVLSEHELDYQRCLLKNEEMRNMNKLEKFLGTRSYLETLHKQQFEGQNPDPCPICKNTLEQCWAILPCGHSYCMECIQVLVDNSSRKYFICSVCRGQHTLTDLSYIKIGAKENENPTFSIKGNYSTKIEAVIRLLLELKADDEDIKVLVFSNWMSVLKFLKTALSDNDITSELLLRSTLEKQIEKFKDPKNDVTALLLPISLGSKGLNLTEATHVVLLEPLLNPGDELQAIGRVHRIGQTKPTIVHKFYIKNTIEDNIYNAVSSNAESWDKNKVTICQLTNLFNNEDTAIINTETSIDENQLETL